MAERDFSEERLISFMFYGVWKSRCLSVLVSLAVPELLGNSCSPVSIQEIAERTGCRTDEKINKLNEDHRRFHGRRRHLGSGANPAKFTVNVWEKS